MPVSDVVERQDLFLISLSELVAIVNRAQKSVDDLKMQASKTGKSHDVLAKLSIAAEALATAKAAMSIN
jgi:hypothetical protein